MSKQKTRLPSENREKLFSVTLDDCDLSTFSAGGPGGQHQNTSNTAVRIKHRESGAVGESREHRSQLQNKKAAFRRMTEHPKFKIWMNRKIWLDGKTPEQKVREDMQPWNLRVEEYKDNEWHIIG
jgi:hypothetical protein